MIASFEPTTPSQRLPIGERGNLSERRVSASLPTLDHEIPVRVFDLERAFDQAPAGPDSIRNTARAQQLAVAPGSRKKDSAKLAAVLV
jgi:hypothetical protein